jgi:hypothetical protein
MVHLLIMGHFPTKYVSPVSRHCDITLRLEAHAYEDMLEAFHAFHTSNPCYNMQEVSAQAVKQHFEINCVHKSPNKLIYFRHMASADIDNPRYYGILCKTRCNYFPRGKFSTLLFQLLMDGRKILCTMKALDDMLT